MTGKLTAADHARFARGGVVPLASAEGLDLFDLACARDEAVLVPVRLDVAALAAAGPVPPLLRGLVRPPARPTATVPTTASTDPADHYASLPAAERERALRELVRAEAALVLAYPGPEQVNTDRGFLELGFDSLSAVELRNRLGRRTGLTLPATLLFDHPTPAALAAHLAESFPSDAERLLDPILAELDRLGAHLPDAPADDDPLRDRVANRLRELLARVGGAGGAAAGTAPTTVGFDEATDDEIFQFLDNELGS
ncbi:phosphopantetheine-binding protein [Micromonospora mangrovi]